MNRLRSYSILAVSSAMLLGCTAWSMDQVDVRMEDRVADELVDQADEMQSFDDTEGYDDAEGYEEPEDNWTILYAGTVIAEPGRPAARTQTILVRNRVIESIENGFLSDGALEALGVPLDVASKVDLKESYVFPGMIDAHVHMDSNDNSPYYYSEEAAVGYSLLDIMTTSQQTLNAGFTTVRDMGTDSHGIAVAAEAISMGEITGPEIVFSGSAIHVGSFAGPSSCHSPATCRSATLAQIEKGATWIKVYGTCSGFESCGGPDGKGLFFKDELRAIVQTAANKHVKVAMHAHSDGGIYDALNAGVTSVEHGTFTSPESRKLFLKNGAYVVPTISVLDTLVEPDSDILERPISELAPEEKVIRLALEEHPKRVGLAIKAGVKIGVGSDAGLTAHGDNANELLRLVDAGMTPSQALRAATVVNAEMLGKSEEIGTLAPGKDADLVAVASNPLADIEAILSPTFVMADGKIVVGE